MAGYSELIKNFEKIRSFIRDLYIYGYKGRGDFENISDRSYDNERRRIESYLSEHIVKNYNENKKIISISSNTTCKTSNPLFKTWQTKSFTKKDCYLHFVLLDILSSHSPLSVTQISEIISKDYTTLNYSEPIDTMTIRNKLNDYTKQGILIINKHNKTYYYSLAPNPCDKLNKNTLDYLNTALSYYKNISPVGFVAHSITNTNDSPFIYKQIFFSQILDDEILLNILTAINNTLLINLTTTNHEKNIYKIPSFVALKVFCNTSTGRRYVKIFNVKTKKFSTLRLDHIKTVTLGNPYPNYNRIHINYEIQHRNSFSIMPQKSTLHFVRMLLSINERTEPYVLQRLKREGKHGIIKKISTSTFEYKIEIADTLEMLPWLRTFIGRIIEIEGSETEVISQFKNDIQIMQSLYGNEK